LIDYSEAGHRILDARERGSIMTPKSEVFEKLSTRGNTEKIPEPPIQSLNHEADSLAAGVRELNGALADLRLRLFGDLEGTNPIVVPDNSPLASIQNCIEEAQLQLRFAHDQLKSILNRI
jgi:hypothetical protein